MSKLDALVFDAYGTLFDVHSVTALAETFFPGQGEALSLRWRGKQLEYTWLRSLMGTYENFDSVTEAALRYACAALKLNASKAQIAALIAQYIRLDTFPEVKTALPALKPGRKLAILSNGAPGTLAALVQHSGLDTLLDAAISVDALRVFKPDQRVYQLAVERLDVPKQRIGFVSSNCWDAIAAKTFGFTVFWVNRLHAPVDLHGPAPDHTIASLDQIEALL